MNEINVRYGETFDLSVESDDLTAESVTLTVAKPGATPVISIMALFVEGVAFISSTEEDTKIPLGEYNYMLTVRLANGKVHKYPTNDDCLESGLPEFNVLEALDETEVV